MVGNAEFEEQTLIQRALRGDLESFNALILRYQDSAYTLAYRIMGDSHSASDALQEAFIIAYRRLGTYRGGSFRAWLMRITTNQCYDELRRVRRRPSVSVEAMGEETGDDPAIPDGSDTPEEVAVQRELQQAIQQCITSLNPDQRVVLVMCDVDGMDYQAIADTVGAQIGTVKSRLSRARAAVRDCLQGVRELLPPAFRLTSNDDDD
jgi:RNA polymerase sigma-70 factor (ECF subfamily)